MTIFYRDMSTDEVAAAAALAMLRDFRANGFLFRGFPAISATLIKKEVHISISAGGNTVGPIILSLKKAIAVITDFRKAKKQDDEFFMTIQKGVIDLETACLDRKLA